MDFIGYWLLTIRLYVKIIWSTALCDAFSYALPFELIIIGLVCMHPVWLKKVPQICILSDWWSLIILYLGFLSYTRTLNALLAFLLIELENIVLLKFGLMNETLYLLLSSMQKVSWPLGCVMQARYFSCSNPWSDILYHWQA